MTVHFGCFLELSGPVSDLLNVEFSRASNGDVSLTQGSYIDRMAARYLPPGQKRLGERVTPRLQTITIWENVDDLAATLDVEVLAPFAANVDNNVEC